MIPFNRLTPSGQARRVRSLALVAMARYEQQVERCSFVTESFNMVFRILTRQAGPFALRVSPSVRIHPVGSEGCEAAWLDALAQGRIPVPRVMRTTDGEAVVSCSTEGVPVQRTCLLFSWVRGRTLRERMSRDAAHGMGSLSARLHEHAARAGTLEVPSVSTADRVLYWRIEDRLSELRPSYGALLTEAHDRSQRAIDLLWREPPHAPHLVHGDLVPANIMSSSEGLTLIDFQDLFWGFEAQDLAITLASLQTYGDPLVDAFRTGYQEVRPWPSVEQETFAALVAARYLHQLNLALHLRKPGLERYVTESVSLVGTWMRTRAR